MEVLPIEWRIPEVPVPAEQPAASYLEGTGISPEEAERIAESLARISVRSAPAVWRVLTREVLRPDHPHALHRVLKEWVYARWEEAELGPPPLWFPDEARIQQSNAYRVLKEMGFATWEAFHRWSVRDRLAFWARAIREWVPIRFYQSPGQIARIEDVRSPEWFPGALLNIVESCFQAEASQPALYCQYATGEEARWTYSELREAVERVAFALAARGVRAGTPVALCIPLHGWSVIVYLAVVWLGAYVVSIAESLATEEILKRIEIGGARLVITQDVVFRKGKELPLYARLRSALPSSVSCIVWRRVRQPLHAQDIDLESVFASKDRMNTPHYCSPMDTINVLFSSGTTGEPKAIPWNHTTPIKCAVDGFFFHDIQLGTVCTWPTSLGWMMGPWLVFSTLLNRGTIALYEDTPVEEGFVDFLERAGVQMVGLVPSLVKAWRRNVRIQRRAFRTVRVFSSTGEPSQPEDYHWLMARVPGYVPVIEYCGGTEIGGGYISGTVLHPSSPSTFTTAAPSLDFVLLEEGQPAQSGELFLVPPSIGLSVRLLNRDHHTEYFSVPEADPEWLGTTGVPLGEQAQGWTLRLRRHGDEMERLANGYFRALGRADDTMNLSGIKVSSAEIERVLNEIEGVVETAAVGVPPPEGGPERLIVYAVVEQPVDRSELKRRMQQAIRTKLNPLFHLFDVQIVESLPRTPTNKIMRRLLRKQYSEMERAQRG